MSLSNIERRAIFSLASILAFRMLGLFMIFPIFAIYAAGYTHSTPTLVGLAFGIYGFTQGVFQLPASMMSDRIGRRPIILGGLMLFALGSIIAATTQNIYILIIGRALQGAGAIGSTLMALAADLTSTENRTQAMAILGMTIGISFTLAMTVGPFINSLLHLQGIFWLTALFALTGIIIFQHAVPQPEVSLASHKSGLFIESLQLFRLKPELLKFNISICLLHMTLTSSFMAIPFLFAKAGIPAHQHWQIYLIALFTALFFTLPAFYLAEKKHSIKATILLAIICIACSEFFFANYSLNKIEFISVLILFFTGFIFLETILPSLISKIAPLHQRGSAMGLYSTFQFLGIFLGGLLGGMIKSRYLNESVFFAIFLVCLLWLIYMTTLKRTPAFKANSITI